MTSFDVPMNKSYLKVSVLTVEAYTYLSIKLTIKKYDSVCMSRQTLLSRCKHTRTGEDLSSLVDPNRSKTELSPQKGCNSSNILV